MRRGEVVDGVQPSSRNPTTLIPSEERSVVSSLRFQRPLLCPEGDPPSYPTSLLGLKFFYGLIRIPPDGSGVVRVSPRTTQEGVSI